MGLEGGPARAETAESPRLHVVPARLEAKGANGTIAFDGETVSITRPGVLATLVGRGSASSDQRIALDSIGRVWLWPGAASTNGFLQLTLVGREPVGDGLAGAERDELTVLFGRRSLPEFEQVRAAIDAGVANRRPRRRSQ